jgi:murein DD-endopeptidase MepM/ murein hydrolase activator NlpD
MREPVFLKTPTDIPAEEWGPGYRLWQAFLTLLGQRGPAGTISLVRLGSHLMVILVAIAVLWFSRVQLPKWEISEVVYEGAESESVGEFLQDTSAVGAIAANNALVRAAVPITLVQDRSRMTILSHTVTSGDSLYAIAAQYGISAETLMWANDMELNPDLLRLGQELVVLPVNGVYHTVEAGDTLETIAKKYKARVADILTFETNQLDPENPQIGVGQKLVVPNGVKPAVVRRVQVYEGPIPENASVGTGRFGWPAAGAITQTFKRLHKAVDIGAYAGAPIKAADSGYVVVAGWSNMGYGYHVVIDHGNGFQTLYAHLIRYYVAAGDSVAKGTIIGQMGSTGNSTGPHLHFEIRQGGIQRNPFGYLP